MTRTRYETDQHLAREQQVAAIVEQALGVTLRKLPERYRLDFIQIRDGVPIGFVEMKDRSALYPTIMFDAHKWSSARELYMSTGLITTFILSCGPRVLATELKVWLAMPDVRFVGRTDRDDWQDTCVMGHLPLDAFRDLTPTT